MIAYSIRNSTAGKVLATLSLLGADDRPRRLGTSRYVGGEAGLSGSTVTTAIKALEQDGYLVKSGARNPTIKLTDKAFDVLIDGKALVLTGAIPEEAHTGPNDEAEDQSPLPTLKPAGQAQDEPEDGRYVSVDRVIFERMRKLLDLGESGFALAVARELIEDYDERTEQ